MAWRVIVQVLCLSVAGTLLARTPVASGEVVGGTREQWVEHRDAAGRDPGVLRYYTFEGVRDAGSSVANLGGDRAEPLRYQAVPAPNAAPEEFGLAQGRFPGKSAVHLDQGCYIAKAPVLAGKAFTATLWFRKLGQGVHRGNSGAANGMLIAVGNGYWDGWRLTTNSPSGTIGFEIGRPQPSSSVGASTGPVAERVWHHLAATWDGRTMRVYVDGDLSAEREHTGVYTPPVDGNLRIGFADSGVGSASLDIDEVAIYRRAMGPEDVVRDLYFYAGISDAQLKLWTEGTEQSLTALLQSPNLHQDFATAARMRLMGLQLRSGGTTPTAAAEELTRVLDTPAIPSRLVAQARTELLSLMKGGVPVRRELYEQFMVMDGVSYTDRLSLRLGMGHALVAGRDYAGACAEYAKVVNMEDAPPPWRCLALMCMGQAYVRAGDFAAARASYEKAKAIPGEPRYRAVEIGERLKEIERLQAGRPARDAMEGRAQLPDRPAPGVTLYVAADGKDTNSGTRLSPFATLGRARDQIREMKSKGGLPRGGVAVLVGGGRYVVSDTFRLSGEDSGTAEAPITYEAMEGQTPAFDAGRTISGFEPMNVESRVPEEIRGKIYRTDLRAQGITDLGKFEPGGFASARGFVTHPMLELFFDGKAMPIARWPNDGFVHIAEVPQATKGVFTCNEQRIARWSRETDPWLYGYWFYDWADSYEKIAAIDPAAKRITLAPPFSTYGEGGTGFKAGQRFYAVNVLSEIDMPGEWYLDRETGVLYFYPPSAPDKAKIQISMLERPVVEMQGVSHVTMRGLTWENGRGDGIRIADGESCLIAGCTLRQFGGNGIEISGGKGHGILGCDIHTLGRGGTVITGGDRKLLTPGGHFVENCHIHHFSRIDHTYTPAVLLNGVGGRIAHNLMHDSYSSAMRVEGNDHLIEYNDVHHVLLDSDDQGGADMWGDPTYRGNVYRYNRWHDMDGAKEVGGAGIRLDDMISGTVIYGNIFQRCSAGMFGGVQMNGGKENLIENNLFIDCRYAISGGSRDLAGWQKFLQSDFGRQRVEAFKLDEPPYSTRYPELQQLDTANLINYVWRNVAVNCGTFVREAQQIDQADNWISSGNPGFAAPAKGNFTVQKRSPLDSRLSFAPIPFEEIGLYTDQYRKTR